MRQTDIRVALKNGRSGKASPDVLVVMDARDGGRRVNIPKVRSKKKASFPKLLKMTILFDLVVTPTPWIHIDMVRKGDRRS